MLAAIWYAHVKDMRWAVCGSSSWSQKQEMTSDMKFTDRNGEIEEDDHDHDLEHDCNGYGVGC